MFIALGFLLFISFFLSGSETALTAVNRMKVQLRADQGDKKAIRLLNLISKPSRMITAILIGNNIANRSLFTATSASPLRDMAHKLCGHVGPETALDGDPRSAPDPESARLFRALVARRGLAPRRAAAPRVPCAG